MQLYNSHPVVFVAMALIFIFISILLCEALYIKYAGKPVPVPNIPKEAQTIGNGELLTYAILGDSTAVGQGGKYEEGIALATARFLASKRQVSFQNFAVSGARTSDVLHKQVEGAARLQPDVVLVAVGGNDVTHLSSLNDVKRDMAKVIDKLYVANPSVEIILTGSPAMGAVPRFPWPVNYFAKFRTMQVNKVIYKLAQEKSVIFAPIAAKTGPAFENNPDLFAQDKFHPNTSGYNVWIPVLKEALIRAGLVHK